MHASRRITALIVAGVLALAACGDDDSTTDDTAPPDTTPATEAPTTAAPATDPPPTDPPPTEAPTTEPPSTDAPSESTMSADDAAAVDEAAEIALEEASTTSGATAFYVAISDPDTGDYVQAYGDASVDGPAATVDDNFRIGSITKTFTATVILQMIENGEVALDDTVQDLLPDYAVDHPEIADVTVEQLLSMTSGIPDYLNVPDGLIPDLVADPSRVWGTEELIAVGLDAGVAAPGTAGYSTTNYLILQLIAESTTGTPLAELIAEQVTGPLDLEDLYLPPDDDTTLPDPATSGYVAGQCVQELEQDGATVEDGTDTTDWNASYGQGGGGMTSTIADLLGWASSTSGNDLLDADLAEQRLDTSMLPEGIPYGLGIMEVGAWVGHEGEAIGWEALAVRDPDTGVSVAVAANGCGGLILAFTSFLDALYPDGGATAALMGVSAEATEEGAATTDAPVDTTVTTPASTEAPATTSAASSTEVPTDGASGTASFRAGDLQIDGEVVACSIDGTNVDMNINAENAGIEVYSIEGGQAGVIVSGMAEWEGRGDVTVDGGAVTIVGMGSPQGAGTQPEDFTLEAQISSC